MSSRKSRQREDVRFLVLRLLEGNPEMSQRELAKAVGISTGGVCYLLKALTERGLVKLGNFSASTDKRRYAYVLTPKGMAEKAAIAGRFLARKREEYDSLKREISDLETEFGILRTGIRESEGGKQ